MRDAQIVVATSGMGVSDRNTGVSFGVSVDKVALVSAYKLGGLERWGFLYARRSVRCVS